MPSSSTTTRKRSLSDVSDIHESDRKKIRNMSDVSSDYIMAELPHIRSTS
jgi:hypothetical protein